MNAYNSLELKPMEWVDIAEDYIAQYGWGSRGRNNSASKLLHDGERQSIARGKWVAGIRPRGVLSGFLAIVPRSNGVATFLPPLTVKLAPQRIRLRISEELAEQGAVFSAYKTREGRLVLEDVLVWKGDPIWYTVPFPKRMELMNLFGTQEWRADTDYQGVAMEFAQYTPLSAAKDPDASFVLEFIPMTPNQRRLIWIPGREAETKSGAVAVAGPARTSPSVPSLPAPAPAPSLPAPAPAPSLPASSPRASEGLVAKKEGLLGPDVYSVWRGTEKLGLALVRTLAISRALRMCTAETIRIEASWNKQFDKWEVTSIRN